MDEFSSCCCIVFSHISILCEYRTQSHGMKIKHMPAYVTHLGLLDWKVVKLNNLSGLDQTVLCVR